MSDTKLKIERELSARIETVWKAWSDPAIVATWYGPGVETIMHHFDFREGGYWHEEMRMGENSMFGRTEFVEIVPQKKIVIHQSSSNADGEIIDNPMMPDWPRVMEAAVTFEPMGDKTRMVFTWAPFQASDEEIAMFASMKDRMGEGWSKGFDIMDAEIEKL